MAAKHGDFKLGPKNSDLSKNIVSDDEDDEPIIPIQDARKTHRRLMCANRSGEQLYTYSKLTFFNALI